MSRLFTRNSPGNIFYIHPPFSVFFIRSGYHFSDKCINQGSFFTPFCYSAYYDQQTANIKNNAAVKMAIFFPILYFFPFIFFEMVFFLHISK